MKLDLKLYRRITNTPALPLLLNGWQELLQRELLDPGAIMIAWDHQAIVATALDGPHDGRDIGVLSFLVWDYLGEIGTILSWVHPTARLNGVHKQMFARLVEYAQEIDMRAITSATHVDNRQSQQAHQAEGRQMFGHTYKFMVQPKGD